MRSALLVVGVRLVPVVFKMDISVSEDYLFLTGRETALIAAGFWLLCGGISSLGVGWVC